MIDNRLPDFRKKIEKNHLLSLLNTVSDEEQIESYLVGGWVRDQILKRENKPDIDVVCIGNGIRLAQAVHRKLGRGASLTVYRNFGTAAVRFENHEIEFVGARKESYRSNSRKPIVEDGSLTDDQNRRDFTINAMAVALNSEKLGSFLDPFNGLEDLHMKTIRTPLDPRTTFSDDPLRMLRAVRFAAQLNFDIEPDTFKAISAMSDRLKIISFERITTEINKIILTEKPSYGFNLLYHSGLLKEFFPEMVKLQGVKTIDGKGHKDNFYHTLKVLDNICELTPDLWCRWAAILHDIAKPATQKYVQGTGWTFHGHEDLGARWVPKIFARMKLPLGEPLRKVQNLVKLHLRPIALVNEQVTDSAIRRLMYEAGEDIDDLMKLCRADITSKNNEKIKKYLANFDLVEKKIIDLEAKDHIRNFKLPVTGEDIMNMYQIPPGRVIGELKDRIKEAILDGEIPNEREPAIRFLKGIAEKKGLTLQSII